jgi:hypothetical protein
VSPGLAYCEELRLARPFMVGRDDLLSTEDPTLGCDVERLAADFRCVASVGDCGSAFEQGLASVSLSLDGPLAQLNSSFLRDEAFLLVVFLSDEDDCSGEVVGRDDDCHDPLARC